MVSSIALLGAQQAAAAGTVTHYSLTFLQTSFMQGMPNSLIIKAVDDTETQVSGYNSAVNITCSDPYAVLPTNRTLLINNGIGGGITLHFGTAGTQTLTVTDTTDNTLVGTVTLTVAPVHYSVSVSPTNITVGQSVNVTVAVLNETNSVVPEFGNSGYGGSILFSSTDSLAVFPAQGSPSTLTNGNRTFPITLNTTGLQTITLVNQAFPLLNATTSAITVNALVQATATPTPTAAPTQTAAPTATAAPTTQPTQVPTATPTPQVTNASNNNLVIIAVIVVVVVIVALVAIVFLRKKRGVGSDLPPPPPPPT